jgi:serine/threonine-protein kinase
MRASVIAGALLVAGGAAVAAYGATRPKPGKAAPGGVDPTVTAAEQALDARLGAAKTEIDARVAELAAGKPVQFAVASDVATTANLTYADLMFQPAEREIVELGQIAAGALTSLTVLPATAPRSKHLATPGLYVGAASNDLVVTVVGAVEPAARQGEGLEGRIAVSRTIDVAPDLAALRQKGIAARIDTGDGAIVVGTDPGAGARDYALGGGSMPAHLVTAAAPAAGGKGGGLGWLLWPGVAAAALGLVLVVVGMRKRPPTNLMFADTQMTPSSAIPAHAGTGTAVGRPASRLIPQATPEGTNPAGGPMFGRYQLVRKLGAGGMADVFLARSQGEAGFSKLVALKLLHSHLASRPQAMAHFLDEARLASNLHHPNIVNVIDLGKVEEDYFIAMEYIEGSDLERLIQVGRVSGRYVPLPIAMTILRRVCDGLDAAHKAVSPEGVPLQIVHRDVKSGNVLVSKQGQVKISDFGIAKASSQVHTTQIGETKGTPSVMAPEQRMGQIVDLRADVYSVAALGYELFTSAEMNLDLVQLAQLGIEGWPHLPPPSEVRNELPRELDAVLLGALAFQPEARPGSCHDLEEALAQIANRYNLVCSDKDIARWLEGELARMPRGADGGVLPSPAPPVGAAG